MFRHVAQNSPHEGIKAYLDFSLFSYNNKTMNKVRLQITDHGKKKRKKKCGAVFFKKSIKTYCHIIKQTLQDFFAVY